MKPLVVAAVALGIGLTAPHAVAETGPGSEGASKSDMNALFSAFGFTEKRQISGKTCRVVADVNQDALIKAVPLLQKLDLLNSEMTQSVVRSKPTKVSMAFAVQMASLEVKNFFDDEKSVDRCAFIQNLTFLDEYGNDKTIPMFSYDFDRSTYGKINWDKFQSTNIIKVAKGFKFSPEVAARTSEEPD